MQSTSVSIDGSEATHDRLRGVIGAHRSALAAAAHLKAAGIGLTVNTQINRLSMRVQIEAPAGAPFDHGKFEIILEEIA